FAANVDVNTYGNSPYSTMAANRRVVCDGRGNTFTAVNIPQKLEWHAPGGEIITLFDELPVGQLSYYDGYVYFSDYYLHGVEGNFDSGNLYRVNIKENELEPELIYEARVKRERFAAFQLSNGFLYLTGSQEFSTFGVKKANIDGGEMQTLLSNNKITAAQVNGSSIYYLIGSDLYRSPLRGVGPKKLLENVKSFVVDDNERDEAGGMIVFLKTGEPGLFAYHFRDSRTYALADQEIESIMEDIAPSNKSYFQPMLEGGHLYYFTREDRRGSVYRRSAGGGEPELLYDWEIPTSLD
ncbi:MAG: DUF5050 domain-containing protein, partial [Oscillospiraceae bacterium]|nr:DUF5050 domain-containing protein [Oscillospiraceae bacterium]